MNQKSLDKNKTKELEYVITWVMAKANGIDDYNWGQKQFEKDLRKKLELLLTQQRTELLEEILNLECLKEWEVGEKVVIEMKLELLILL